MKYKLNENKDLVKIDESEKKHYVFISLNKYGAVELYTSLSVPDKNIAMEVIDYIDKKYKNKKDDDGMIMFHGRYDGMVTYQEINTYRGRQDKFIRAGFSSDEKDWKKTTDRAIKALTRKAQDKKIYK